MRRMWSYEVQKSVNADGFSGMRSSTSARGINVWRRRAGSPGPPTRYRSDSWARRALTLFGGQARSGASEDPEAAAAASAASPLNAPMERSWPRSITNSPSATPPRSLPPWRNRPNGRFWMGKSLSEAFALSTQLRRAGSCVSLISMGMVAGLVVSGQFLAVTAHGAEQVAVLVGGENRAPLLVEREDVGHDAFGVAPAAIFA